jgi:hypothetical protein
VTNRRGNIAGLALAFGLSGAVAMAAERSIDKEIVVAASLDDAWAAWTTREGIISFLAPDAQEKAGQK